MVCRVHRIGAVALWAALGGSSVTVQAADLTKAKELFDGGLEHMMAGRYDQGCPMLAESYQLSALPGAVFTLAECEAKWGRLASAQRHYREYLGHYVKLSPDDRKKQAERRRVATDQIEALESTIPRLTLKLPKGASSPKAITKDGASVAISAIGTAIAVDPGEHRIVVEWPDGQKSEEIRALDAGQRVEIVLEPPSPPSGPRGGAGGTAGDDVTSGEPGEAVRLGGYVVGAIGLASLIAGAITGGAAMGTKSGIEDNCAGTVCTQEGKDAADTTQALGNASTATFVIGGAALVAGIIMIVAAPSAEPEAEPASEGAASAMLRALRPWVDVAPSGASAVLVGVRSRW